MCVEREDSILKREEARKCRYQSRCGAVLCWHSSKEKGKKKEKSRVEEVGSCESRGRIVVSTGQLLVHPIAGARWFVPLTKWRIRKSFSRKLSLAFPLSLYHPTLLPIAIPPPSEPDHRLLYLFLRRQQRQPLAQQQFDKSIRVSSPQNLVSWLLIITQAYTARKRKKTP